MRKFVRTTLFALAAVLTAFNAFSEMREVEDYWQDSNLDFETSDLYLKPVKCAELSAVATLSCLRAYNEAGELAEPQRAFIAKETLARKPSRYKNIEDHGDVVLVELAPRAAVKSFRAFLREKNRQGEELRKAAERLFASKKISISFSQVVRDLRATVPAKIATSQIVGAALTGQASATDAHATFMALSQFEDLLGESSEDKVGVGILFHTTDRGYAVYEIVPGSGAERAGLMDRDLIKSIDGYAIDYSRTVEDVVKRLQGESGAVLRMTVERAGKTLVLPITRAPFVSPNVAGWIDEASKTLRVKIRSFMPESTCTEVQAQIEGASEKGVKAIALDVRNNGGGLIDGAVCIAGLFVGPDQVIVRTKSMGEGPFTDIVTKNAKVTDLPLVVLINEVSASASELLAGGLQDLGRAWIVGERSFGKGTVQDVLRFEYDPRGTVYTSTINSFHQPSGRSNQGEGIYPDFDAPVVKGLARRERWAAREMDLYPGALRLVAQAWTQKRAKEIAALRGCVKSAGATNHDYQLATALNVLSCVSR